MNLLVTKISVLLSFPLYTGLLWVLNCSLNALELELPEIDEINWITAQQLPPQGVVFDIREYDVDALEWVGPRLVRYVELLRARFPDIPIAVVSHGDEMLALKKSNHNQYKRVHKIAKQLVNEHHVIFHLCGSYVTFNGLIVGDFPDYLDVVPFGPTQIADYREVGFEHVTLELTW